MTEVASSGAELPAAMNVAPATSASSFMPAIERKGRQHIDCGRSVIDTKESDGIADPMENIAIKSHSDHSDSGIGKMLILIDAYFVILLQCNKMTK